jgi:hypothetical protein
MLVFLDDLQFGFSVFTKMIKHLIVSVMLALCVLNLSLICQLGRSYTYLMG